MLHSNFLPKRYFVMGEFIVEEKKIIFVTRIRGFLNQLKENPNIKFKIENKNESYEVNTFKKEIISKLIRSKIFNKIGVFQIVKYKNEASDICKLFSFNRFVESKHRYILYVENPTALYHYSLGRNKGIWSKKKIKKLLNSPQLEGIYFMSNASNRTFDEVCGKIPDNKLRETIYPLVPRNPYCTEHAINERTKQDLFKLLFVVQGKRFISKGGKELIKVMQDLQNLNIHLTVITNKRLLSDSIKNDIYRSKNISLIEFNLTYKELEKEYASHHLLIHLSSDDSFGLTILEAMKAGLPIISTNLYAIPEMVVDGHNGFLTEPKYYFFDRNNIPNESVWNHRKKTIYNENFICERIVEFTKEKVKQLYYDRNLLMLMSNNSLKRSSAAPFSEEYVSDLWNKAMGENRND